jgi:hypothetical protein
LSNARAKPCICTAGDHQHLWRCWGHRSRVAAKPPPPRPLVRRAPRAGVQAPDQRFLVPAIGGDAGFSGVFLGALSMLRRACHGRVARRVRPLSSRFVAGFSLEPPVHRAAQGIRMQCTDQPNIGRFREVQLQERVRRPRAGTIVRGDPGPSAEPDLRGQGDDTGIRTDMVGQFGPTGHTVVTRGLASVATPPEASHPAGTLEP